MASPEVVSLVVEKFQKGFEAGDVCNAVACGKTVPEWKEIFNDASEALALPLVPVEPMQGGSMTDTHRHLNNLTQAFEKTAGARAIVLADSTGNAHQKNDAVNWRIANYTEHLAKKFPNAVYVQIVPDMHGPQPFLMYCNNPKTPHDPSKPLYPL